MLKIQWEELTGEEHLMLFAGLRNIPQQEISAEAHRLLKEVGMLQDGKIRTKMYSGGMRRRISLAICKQEGIFC